jgi:transcriptional regulator with XRE-family HTH domain
MPNVRATPTVRRRRLGKELRKFRTASQLKLEEVAELMGEKWNYSKLSRIEGAIGKINAPEVVRLLGHYGVTDPEVVGPLEELARNAGKRGWWNAFGEIAVPQTLEDLIEAEETATTIRAYYGTALPGWLQTAAYAREVTEASAWQLSKEQRASIVDVRMNRQAVVNRPENPPKLLFVLHEALLVQQCVSDPSLMRDQLERLLEWGARENVTILVVPMTAWLHPGNAGNFALFQFPKPWPTLVMTEGQGRMQYEEADEVAEKFTESLDRIMAAALPADQSRELIKKHMEGHR